MIIEVGLAAVALFASYKAYKNGKLKTDAEALLRSAQARAASLESDVKTLIYKVEAAAKVDTSKVVADVVADVKKVL